MSRALNISLMVVSLINVVIHSLGSYVLYKLSKHSSDTIINQIFILSLSLSEILICFIFFITMAIGVSVTPMEMSPALVARNYMMIFCDTGIVLIYYLNMMYLTINKLLEIILNIRYQVFINETRIKILLIVTWCFGLTFSISMVLVHRLIPEFQFHVLTMYFYPTLDVSFLSIAILTYGFIFRKFYFSRSHIPGGKRLAKITAQQQESVWNVFRASNFYVSILLISSFLLFTVIPDLTLMLHTLLHIQVPQAMYAVCYILYTFSFFVDAVIYIALQRRVRRRVWRLLQDVLPFKCMDRMLGEKLTRTETLDTSV